MPSCIPISQGCETCRSLSAARDPQHGKGTFTSVVDDPETIALTHLFQARKDDLIVNITFAWEGAIALVGPDGDGALVSHRFHLCFRYFKDAGRLFQAPNGNRPIFLRTGSDLPGAPDAIGLRTKVIS